MAKISNTFENIQRLRKHYYASFQGKQALLDLIAETEVGEQVYNSNAHLHLLPLHPKNDNPI
ncbi:hypothetical protein SPBRAN_494 [uncultured Candidatus Thioglobus sp.]|nr:hypothetical protein SPBRAN_494 [uncultured Candidatus Thioglobus sp.]